MKVETKQWLRIARDDKELAIELWKVKKNVYAIMFWQQAVEKVLKAYITEKVDVLPKKTHDINTLIKQAKLDTTEFSLVNIKELSLAFTRTRYEDLSRQYYAKRTVVIPLVTMAENLYLWIEKQLK